ncbi:hypothetical protein N9N13_06380 [Opitutales bacterium]|nr:hypothetical protein [Opitutales bacterium]
MSSELGKTDGTENGTIRLKEINPGFSSSSPENLTVLGNTLYFRAQDIEGEELWKIVDSQ